MNRFHIDLQGVALNLFNHHNTAPVNTFNVGQQSYVTVDSPQFDRPDLAFSSNPRTLQVVARFSW
jgi:hypothetical protein